MPVSSDLIERTHYKRRSSFLQEQRNRQMLEPPQNIGATACDEKQRVHPPRRKSASVCVSMIPMRPEIPTVSNEFSGPASIHRSVGKSRFIVERNSQPLNLQEFQNVRLRGLSTSEIFHEPPKMYVYRERPHTFCDSQQAKEAILPSGFRQKAKTYDMCMDIRDNSSGGDDNYNCSANERRLQLTLADDFPCISSGPGRRKEKCRSSSFTNEESKLHEPIC
ncbi:hypothetical protein NECAME_08041 [Necator americanus]|uniref:Uncharacterized protein n=1 Tax=Necator americanus TaxID=51031 RepID=W2TL28_NECAM|nr:hypothetical protein NECAME_08041 [Necator americanus]ETN82329.1 hypothetical protein NECAME_08041 [Necator americanus]